MARIDVGDADAETVDQVGEPDRLHRADLGALAALDAGGQEVMLLQRARRAQALPRRVGERQVAGEGGAEHAAGEQQRAQQAPARLLAPLPQNLCLLVVGAAHVPALGRVNRGCWSRACSSGLVSGASRSRKSSSSMTGVSMKKRAVGISIQIRSA